MQRTIKRLAVLTVATLLGCASEDPSASDIDGADVAGEADAPTSLPPGVALDDPQLIESTNVIGEAIEVERTAHPNQPQPTFISREEALEMVGQANLHAIPPNTVWKAGVDFAQIFPADQAFDNTIVAYTRDHVCYMTRIGGRLKGAGTPYFSFGSYDATGAFYAYKPVGPFAGVRCVPRTSFSTANGFLPQTVWYKYGFIWDGQPVGCSTYSWQTQERGDYVSMISGIGYDFNHTNDTFGVVQSSAMNQFTTAFLRQSTAPCRGVGFYIPVKMKNNGTTAKFTGPGGTGTAAQAGEWHYSLANGQSVSVNLGVPYATHSCYYTFLGGNFSSANDWFQLFLTQGNWVLVGVTTADTGIRASVRCIPHAQ